MKNKLAESSCIFAGLGFVAVFILSMIKLIVDYIVNPILNGVWNFEITWYGWSVVLCIFGAGSALFLLTFLTAIVCGIKDRR